MLVAFDSVAVASLVSTGVRFMINRCPNYGQGFYWFLLTFSEGNEKQPANAPTLRSKLLDHRGGNATNFGKRLSVGNDQDRSPDGEILLVGRLENRRAKPELDSSRTAGSRVSPLFQVHRPRFAIVSSPAKSANQNEMGRGQELKRQPASTSQVSLIQPIGLVGRNSRSLLGARSFDGFELGEGVLIAIGRPVYQRGRHGLFGSLHRHQLFGTHSGLALGRLQRNHTAREIVRPSRREGGVDELLGFGRSSWRGTGTGGLTSGRGRRGLEGLFQFGSAGVYVHLLAAGPDEKRKQYRR
ncbi:MAG: hypothetical protein V9H26_09140 [Verrucomicrobiota bacterium]